MGYDTHVLIVSSKHRRVTRGVMAHHVGVGFVRAADESHHQSRDATVGEALVDVNKAAGTRLPGWR